MHIEVEKQNVIVMAYKAKMRAGVKVNSGVNGLAVVTQRPFVDAMFDRSGLVTSSEDHMTVSVGRSCDGSLACYLSLRDKYTLV